MKLASRSALAFCLVFGLIAGSPWTLSRSSAQEVREEFPEVQEPQLVEEGVQIEVDREEDDPFAEIDGDPFDGNLPQHISMQREALSFVIDDWAEQFELDEPTCEKLTANMEERLQDAAVRRNDAGIVVLGTDRLDCELRISAFNELKNVVGGNALEEVEKLAADEEKLDALLDQAAQYSLLIFVDQHLSLTPTQSDAILEMLADGWAPAWNQGVVLMMAMNETEFGKPAIDFLSSKVDAKDDLLTNDQKRVLDSIDDFNVGFYETQRAMPGNGEVSPSPTEIRRNCEFMMELKIAEISHGCDLNEKQKKMLLIASKGATSRVVQRWVDLSGKARALMGMPDRELMAGLSEPLVSQVTSQPIWENTLEKALEEEQIDWIRQSQTRRMEVGKQAMAQLMAASLLPRMSAGKPFTHEQYVAFTEILQESISQDYPGDYISVFFTMYDVPEEKFEAILTGEQWTAFKVMLDQTREMMKQATDEDPNTDDG